jgi:hypothetical protein
LTNQIRFTVNWEARLEFFIDTVCDTATRVVEMFKEQHALAMDDTKKILSLGRATDFALKVYREIIERLIATSASLTKKLACPL